MFLSKLILTSLLLGFYFSSAASAQVDTLPEKTAFVNVPVTVFDRDGRYVVNLRKEDFRIFENGIVQETALFESVNEAFTALLLFDNSGSMNDYLENMSRAANVFLDQMRPEDEIIIGAFSDRGTIKIIVGATKKRNFNHKIRFEERVGDSYTTTFDAVELGIKYLDHVQGRKAIVLFSDGEMHGKRASAKSNLRDAEEQKALIYTIRFGALPTHQPGYSPIPIADKLSDGKFIGDRDRFGESEIIGRSELDGLTNTARANAAGRKKLLERVNSYMNGLASATGGRGFQIDEIKDLEGTFRKIAAELGQQYLLGYSALNPGKSGERRKIKVQVLLPNVAVRSRSDVRYK